MVLYHAVSTFQLLEMIIHKIKFHKNDKAAVLFSTDITERFPDYETRFNKIFDKIYVYQNSDANKLLYQKNGIHENEFILYFEDLISDTDIENFEDVFSSCNHAGFGAYLILKKIPFHFFEDAAGALSHVDGVREHVKKLDAVRAHFLEINGLYDGKTELVKKRWYNFKANPQVEKLDYDIDFDLAKELREMNDSDREIIVGLFISHKISCDVNSVVILTEHLYNLGFLTWAEQKYMYCLFVDYFLKDTSLVFKVHPDDLMYYKMIFPTAQVIREKFPSELLPYIYENKPKAIATVSSTSIYGLEDYFEKKIILNQRFSYFEHEFYYMNRYYVALQIALDYMDNNYNVIFAGCNIQLVNMMLKNSLNKDCTYKCVDDLLDVEPDENKKVIIVDKLCKFGLPVADFIEKQSNSVFVFLNSKEKFEFYDIRKKDLWKYIYPIQIKKIALKLIDLEKLTEQEMIYVYSKEEFRMADVKYDLINSGLRVETNQFEKDKLRIMVLEGMLAATEERLKFYMNKLEEEEK